MEIVIVTIKIVETEKYNIDALAITNLSIAKFFQ